MKQIWIWLGSTTAFRIISVTACVYYAIAAIGSGRDYLAALNSVVLFYAIWALGYHSKKGQQS